MIPDLRTRIAGIAEDTPDRPALPCGDTKPGLDECAEATVAASEHAPTVKKIATTAKHVAPRTPLESDLAAIWRETLELEQVGMDENFFDIGGHSLSAMRIVVRIRSVLNMDVPVACLFQNPTIETLSAAMDWMRSSQDNPEDVLRLLEEIEAMPASNAEGN